MIASYEHRVTTLVGDVAVFALVDTSGCFTSGHTGETANNLKLWTDSIYKRAYSLI